MGLEPSGRRRDIDQVALRPAGQQLPGVSVLGMAKHLRHGAVLDDPALLHHRHTVGETAHQIEIVGDQQHRHRIFLLQMREQLQNLTAQAHVERRCWLIGQQQARLAGQRHRDHGALTLPARELMGKAAGPSFGLGNSGLCQAGDRSLPGLRSRQTLLELQDLSNLIADGKQRIERRHRLLEDHRDLAAAQRLQLTLRQGHQVLRLRLRRMQQGLPACA